VPVDTKAVQGRRELKFTSFDEVIADAENLASSPNVKLLGNWPLSQLLTHLTQAINGSIDGIPHKAPWYVRLLGFFIKGRIIRNGIPPGRNLPKEAEGAAFPPASSPQDALEALRKAVDRLKTEKMTSRHPVFGNLTHEEWTQLHFRHCELHLSFAVPA
jgi:hypothetical protein